jgi:hypothetical protein
MKGFTEIPEIDPQSDARLKPHESSLGPLQSEK